MTDELPTTADGTDRQVDLTEVERTLSERKLEADLALAEIVGVEAKMGSDGDTYVGLTFQTIVGETYEDWIPVPVEYDPERSDLATVIEFVGGDVGDLHALVASRVPFENGSPRYAVMRQVLDAESAAIADWDDEKRLEKARDLL